MNVGLNERVIIVTGAASGIGEAIAKLAALSGARLLLTDRSVEGLQRVADTLPGNVATVVADLSDRGAPGVIVKACLAAFGHVDGLVNAAGLTTRASALDGTEQNWDDLFAVNARAAFFLMQGVLADMLGRKSGGAIVNILSMNALCGAPELAIYSATKGALLTLTKNLANAHLADRIRVNGINLGWVNTPAEHHMQSVILGKGEGWLQDVSAELPLGDLVGAEDAARLAVYLLSDASAPLTGAAIDLEHRVTGAPG